MYLAAIWSVGVSGTVILHLRNPLAVEVQLQKLQVEFDDMSAVEVSSVDVKLSPVTVSLTVRLNLNEIKRMFRRRKAQRWS